MKLLVFGRNGQVASELHKLVGQNPEVLFVGQKEANFLSLESIVKVIRENGPTHIINAAAYTAVDKAETESKQADLINGVAVGVIGEEAKKIAASVLHYSTDYIFDGKKDSPYVEGDIANPLNAYGRSKLKGEKLLAESGCSFAILRVSWVYGTSGTNFLKTMLRLGQEREELRIVDDQIGAPTWSRDIAEASLKVIFDENFKSKTGTYNLSPQGQVSWCGFARAIFENLSRIKPGEKMKINKIIPIAAAEYPMAAMRPLNSRMDSKKIKEQFGVELPHWEESLKKVLSEI